MVLVAVFLVNLPFVHQTLTDRELARSGRDVEATRDRARAEAVATTSWTTGCRRRSTRATRFSARVDRPTYERAQRDRRAAGAGGARQAGARTARGRGAAATSSSRGAARRRRAAARGGGRVPPVAARRGTSWSRSTATTSRSSRRAGRLTVAGPPGWAERLRPAQRVSGGAAPGRPTTTCCPGRQWRVRAGPRFVVRRARAGGGRPRGPGRARARRRVPAAGGDRAAPDPRRHPGLHRGPRHALLHAPAGVDRPSGTDFTFADLLSNDRTSPTVVS